MSTEQTQSEIELRIARAQAARPIVDSQGRPTTPPRKFTYDARGLLVGTAPAEVADDDA